MRSSGTVFRLALTMTLVASSLLAANAQSEKRWFVILQSLPGHAEMAAEKARLEWTRRCRMAPQTASTDIIAGLQPGLQIVFVGPFRSRNAAAAMVAHLRQCAPDAYMKQGSWTGE